MKLLLGFFLLSAVAFAQLDDNTITVLARRPASAAGDSFQVVVTVGTEAGLGLEDILILLKGTGLTADQFAAIQPQGFGLPGSILWSFVRVLPLSKLPEQLASLQKAQQGISQSSTRSLYFSVASGVQSQDACPAEALFQDAKMQARRLADAVGGSVGPLLSLSNGSGPYALVVEGFTLILVGGSQRSTMCNLTAQFRLIR